MRFVLPLVALCAFSSAPLRADMFDITLTGDLSGSGAFTTDGICTFCQPGSGLLSVTIDIGSNSGMDAFDISDDSLAPLEVYFRPLNTFVYYAVNSETNQILQMISSGDWNLRVPGTVLGEGTYTVTPSVPEPRSLFLLMPIVTIVGLRRRHQRYRA